MVIRHALEQNGTMNVAATGESVFEFGPGGAYLGYISDPSRPRSQTGVILFGLGRLESRIARRLAALGLVVMQIRLFKNYAEMKRRLRFYDDSGVSACTQAIDEIISKRRITQVVLMGDCAEANISFNTALVDPRVVGLILTNPNVSADADVVSRGCRMRLFSLAAWRRLLAGDSKLLKSLLRSLGSGAAEQWLAAQWSFRKDVVLPLDFDQKLSSLLRERAVKSLILFSQDRTVCASSGGPTARRWTSWWLRVISRCRCCRPMRTTILRTTKSAVSWRKSWPIGRGRSSCAARRGGLRQRCRREAAALPDAAAA